MMDQTTLPQRQPAKMESKSAEGAEQLDSGHSTLDSSDNYDLPRKHLTARSARSGQSQYQRDLGTSGPVAELDERVLEWSHPFIRKESLLN
jgi:hypothetical protein